MTSAKLQKSQNLNKTKPSIVRTELRLFGLSVLFVLVSFVMAGCASTGQTPPLPFGPIGPDFTPGPMSWPDNFQRP
jgi:hypothetical protein